MNLLSSLGGFFAGMLSAFSMALGASHPLPLPIVPASAPQAATEAAVTEAPGPAVAKHVSAPVAAFGAEAAGPAAASTASASGSAGGLPATGSVWQDMLPLGDGKYVTDGPKKGYVYVCHVAEGGGGAQGEAPWISGSTWAPGEKVAVGGSVAWPSASYSMTLEGSRRMIASNGLPIDHPSGTFPIGQSDPAHQFDANPNSIAAQSYDLSLPADPVALATPDCIYGQVGIMDDGVPLFDGFDAEYRDAVAHETQDQWQAHPDASGAYHYHGFEGGFEAEPVSAVVGFAFDGYPITGGKLPDGTYLTTDDLDECHGITSPIMLDGATTTAYHYVLTQDFPYSVSCFHGESYEPKPGANGQQGSNASPAGTHGAMQGPPPAAIGACVGESAGTACTFATPSSTIAGSCQDTPDGSFACVPGR